MPTLLSNDVFFLLQDCLFCVMYQFLVLVYVKHLAEE